MAFYPPKPSVTLLIVAMSMVVLSAVAQPSGQAIVFSSPQTDSTQPAAPSLVPQNSQLPVLPGTLQAPVTPFNHYDAANSFPAVPPPANLSEQQRMKQMLDERKNWTLMTPAEIFGVTPAEKLLQPPERDAAGREKTKTQLERFLDRENEAQAGPTNGWQNNRDDSPWNFSRDKDNANPFDTGRRGSDDAAQNLDRFLNGQRNTDVSAKQNDVASWDSFNASTAQTSQTAEKQNLDQMAAMERFRQLLAPSPAPAAPSPDSQFFPAPKPVVVDPNITQPDFVPNPAGTSFTPLTSGIGKPAGLTPLPGIVNSALPPVTAPAWAPQPPPWLLQGPQPGMAPQRKF